MKNSAQPRVQALLAAGGGMGSHSGLLARALPFMVAVGNIVTLAYFERYLGEPANRDALLLVAFLQSIQLLLFAFLRLSGPTTEVLSKTALFPLSGRERSSFALLSVLTDRNVLALGGATALSIVILAFSTPLILLWALLACAMCWLSLVAPLTAAFLWLRRRSAPFAILGWAMGLTVAATLAGTLLFRIPSLLEGFLPLTWAADAILKGAAGQHAAAAGSLMPLALLASGSVAASRRLS